MGNPLKLPFPTKLARLGHFPPASQAGSLADPVFYVYVFSLDSALQELGLQSLKLTKVISKVCKGRGRRPLQRAVTWAWARSNMCKHSALTWRYSGKILMKLIFLVVFFMFLLSKDFAGR
jgi:hypothetical protein